MKKLVILLTALVFGNTMAQDMPVVVGPPGTEIIVSNLSISKSGIIISDGINVSNSMGYDSQPEFSADGKTLYFAKYINGQTDIYQHNFFYRNNTVYMKTTESEYSPTRIPGRDGLSVVQVNSSGDQYVVILNKDQRKGKKIKRYSDLKQVGYHNWTGKNKLWTFVINNETGVLYYQDKTKTPQRLLNNIGRTFETDRKHKNLYFTDKNTNPWKIRAMLGDKHKLVTIMKLPTGVEDFAVDHHGNFWAGRNNTLFVSQDGKRWFIAKEFDHKDLGNITRIAVSPKMDKIALVFDELEVK